MKKSNVYTRTGDAGLTSLVGGKRVAKDSIRLEAYGSIDELNSHLGIIASDSIVSTDIRKKLQDIQQLLFNIGGHLACEQDGAIQLSSGIGDVEIESLENFIDEINEQLPPLHSFVLPGGSPLSASIHVCRTVCRRAERRIITLSSTARIDEMVTKYINRLSDLLFVLARFYNITQNIPEFFWKNKK